MGRRHGLAARRVAVGLTQEKLAEALGGISPTTVAGWEAGRFAPRPYLRPALAEQLKISLDDLDQLLMARSQAPTPGGGVTLGAGEPLLPEELSTTDRRMFTKDMAALGVLAVGAGAGAFVAEPLTRLLSGAEPVRVGMADVQAVQDLTVWIEKKDAATGGARLYDVVLALRGQVQGWLQRRLYASTAVADALQTAYGDLSAWLGWLAYDSDDLSGALRHIHETVIQAELLDDPAMKVRGLQARSMYTGDRYPREAAQAAEAALRIAQGWATPRVMAQAYRRAAYAYAIVGDHTGFTRTIAKAKQHHAHGPHPEDPLHVFSDTRASVTQVTAQGYIHLGHPEKAVVLYQERETQDLRALLRDQADDTSDHLTFAYQRDIAFHSVVGAYTKAKAGDISEASKSGVETIPLMSVVDSPRIRHLLAGVRDIVRPHEKTLPAAREFAEAFDRAFIHSTKEPHLDHSRV